MSTLEDNIENCEGPRKWNIAIYSKDNQINSTFAAKFLVPIIYLAAIENIFHPPKGLDPHVVAMYITFDKFMSVESLQLTTKALNTIIFNSQ